MLHDDGSYKTLDEMVMEKDAQRRREEARKKREAAERKQRQIDRERADSTNFDIRTGAENLFYASPNNGGIIRAAKAGALAQRANGQHGDERRRRYFKNVCPAQCEQS